MPSRPKEEFFKWRTGHPSLLILSASCVPAETSELIDRSAVAEIAMEKPPSPTIELRISPLS